MTSFRQAFRKALWVGVSEGGTQVVSGNFGVSMIFPHASDFY